MPSAERSQLPNQAPSFLCLLWIGSVEPLFEADRRAATELAATMALTALRRYEIAHGRIPGDLQTAAGESILRSVPIDPFSGSPLRLAIVGDQTVVYSIGPDGKDDGGRIEWNPAQRTGDYVFTLRR